MAARQRAAKEQPLPWNAADGWNQSSVKLDLPRAKKSWKNPESIPKMTVEGVWYRNIVDVIKAAFQSEQAREFHMKPFKMMWKPCPDQPELRIYGETFWAERMIRMDRELPHVPDCHLERVTVAMQLWSDSTHLTSFGTQKMWPIYLYLGNLSKYTRGKPSSFSANHIAYIPSLPDKIRDVYQEIFNQLPSKNELAHLRRELVHVILAFIFSPSFREAYLNGVEVQCIDGILRRLFPRLFSYSADYVEKVLLAAMMFLSEYPCPACMIQKHQISQIGTIPDMNRLTRKPRVDSVERQRKVQSARNLIFHEGYAVKSPKVLGSLKVGSYTPTLSHLSTFFLPLEVNMFDIFPTDILHDFELGKWRDVFTHLCRILQSIGGEKLNHLNKRQCSNDCYIAC
ncbi:hypothetical protein K435DRAFT_687006 [Dendrothele bispora CBS 962.96]|uniref:Uncharacterized protein n=1 Tax=Dendrothele bispora (strain CBS 962.96) TaxID=1314807 RepID=A0A4S8L859_DENBC|nr:hypothetical protein K435DRAFT_687006 [Dendrothele bispora CBS 962.96]